MNQNRPNLFVAVFALAFLGAASVAQAQELWCYDDGSTIPQCQSRMVGPLQTSRASCIENRDQRLRSSRVSLGLCGRAPQPFCFSRWSEQAGLGAVSCLPSSQMCNLFRDAAVMGGDWSVVTSCDPMSSSTSTTQEDLIRLNGCLLVAEDPQLLFAIWRRSRPETLDAYLASVNEQVDYWAERAQEMVGYCEIVRETFADSSLRALVAQGHIYDALAAAVLDTPFVIPTDLRRQMRGLPPSARDAISTTVEDRLHQVIYAETLPIECLAIQRYILAENAARAANLTYSEQAIFATERLNAYGEERVAACSAAN